MVILDLSIVNVALPSIQVSLGFSANDLQWIVNAYAITFAGFLMLGGRAADMFGQRRTFVVALVLFAAASLAGGLAPDQTTLIVARGAQGFAGALMAATSLAIITSSFAAGPARYKAIALWGAMNGVGGAAGVLLGGILTEAFSWRWILLINPPIALAAAAVAYRIVKNRRREHGEASFDLAGAITLTGGQIVLVYGIVTAGIHGWGSPDGLIPIASRRGAARAVRRHRDALRRRAARPVPRSDEAGSRRERDRPALQRRAVPDVVRDLALSPAGPRVSRRSTPG